MAELRHRQSGAPSRRSWIKPHLQNLSSSAFELEGVIAERNIERPSAEHGGATAGLPKHVLVVVNSGRDSILEWTLDGRHHKSKFSSGDLIVNPAGLFAQPKWHSDVELLLLALDPAFASQIVNELNRGRDLELIPRFQFRDELVLQLVDHIVRECEHGQPIDRVYTESLTYALLTHLARKYAAGPPAMDTLRAHRLPPRTEKTVIDYIEAHLSDELSLLELSKVAGISPSYFAALFKRSTGRAPHQYIMRSRLRRAQQLLQDTHLSIAEIAARTGHADQSHLTRSVRRYFGTTPSALRRR